MSEQKGPSGAPQASELQRGLPMVAKWDPEALAREKAVLVELDRQPLLKRWRGYLGRTGPGWLQSALTLGAGSATSSLFAGALLGYALTWVQPLGMLVGIIMFAAIAYQTLSTGVRPFEAMSRYVHPSVAWAWAIGSLVATIIWHFPQYACGGAVLADMADIAGWHKAPQWLFGLAILAVSTWVTWLYGGSSRGVKRYEQVLKWMVWIIIAAFLLVIVKTGIRWGELWKGLTGFPGNIPRDGQGVEVMIGGLSACVGINMTFLFPYTLLAKGWGKEHRGLSKFDLLTGMWFPFVLATGFLVIAAGNTLYNNYDLNIDKGVTVVGAARIFSDTMGLTVGRLVFGVGILGMVLSSITLHMVVSAFIVCEMLKIEPTGWRYRLASLIPVPGVLGTVFWGEMRLYLGVPTSAICGFLLPIAYIGFFILHNRRDYMGEAKPRGARAAAWNLSMLACIAVVSVGALYYAYVSYIKGGGAYDTPKATVEHLKLMAEDGHKSRALACFDEKTREKIQVVEKFRRFCELEAEAPPDIKVASYMDALVEKLSTGKLEFGEEKVDGDNALLGVQLNGEQETIAFAFHPDVKEPPKPPAPEFTELRVKGKRAWLLARKDKDGRLVRLELKSGEEEEVEKKPPRKGTWRITKVGMGLPDLDEEMRRIGEFIERNAVKR